MSAVKKLCICAMCAALCCILPTAFHAFGNQVAAAASPMHFPVLLCGLICGWRYGGVCGLIGPLLALLVTGKPMPPRIFYMTAELISYGVLTGLFMKYIRTGRTYLDLYCALIPAMFLGRVVGGVVEALVLGNGFFTFFVGSYLVGTAPGAVAQLIVIPALYLALTAFGLIPPRYERVSTR